MAAQLKGNTGSAMLEFSLNLYKGCLDGDNNAFMSPFSVCAALLLADLGANSDTELEIRKALGLDKLSQSEVHERYKAIQDSLNAQSKGSTTLETANRIFSCLGVTVDKGYAKDSEKYYGSGLELMDFKGDGEGSRQKINKWVEKKTRDKIRDLLPMGIIRADTLMVLVNAIYFKGKWLEPFEKRATRDTPFYVTKNNTTDVKMMRDKQKVRYVANQELKCTAVELPYQDGNVTMVLIRPDDVEGLKQLEASLTGSTFESLLSALSGTYKQDVNLGIPRFKMEATYALVPVLAALGITSMFDPAKSDFSKMLPDNPDAFVSAVIHKAFVEVNEEGTEAAAAIAMIMTLCCVMNPTPLPEFISWTDPVVNEEGTEAAAATAIVMTRGCARRPKQPEQFILDRPFVFAIRDKRSNSVLFMGRYRTPE